MQVINLFAGPGAGKSTTAAGVFHLMKKRELNVELVTEYAKEICWEGHNNILRDQLFVLAHQNRRLRRLEGQVDFVITDSPLLLTAYFNRYGDPYIREIEEFAHIIFSKYNNINFFINRTKKYNAAGRLGGEDNALEADVGIKELLKHYEHRELIDDKNIVESIVALSTEFFVS